LAESLRPEGAKTLANGKTREEGACVLLGLLTGFLSHSAILGPLAKLHRDKKRLETAFTRACLAFWQS
jgi:hypothetical protein